MNLLYKRLDRLEAKAGKRELVVVFGDNPLPEDSEGKLIVRVRRG